MGDTSSDDQRPTAGRSRERFLTELRDAIASRTLFLVLGVLAIQLAFVLSYVGAFHHPTPHRVPLAVTAPAGSLPTLVAKLDRLPGQPLDASPVADEQTGLARLHDGATSGVLAVNPSGTADKLFVAGGGGAAVVTALEDVIDRVEAAQHRTVEVVDAVPAQPGDARGFSGFYLVIGWLIGGYLAAALISIAHGAHPASTRRAVIRLIAMVLYALFSGIGGALIVGPVLGALTGHLVALWLVGALLVLSAAAVTMAFQAIAGVLGIGLTVVLFVVLGNPSAGGAYPPTLLPGLWRAISPYIPNGAGVEAIRRIVYFGAHDIAGALLVVAIYAALGAATAIGIASLRDRGAQAQTITPAARALDPNEQLD